MFAKVQSIFVQILPLTIFIHSDLVFLIFFLLNFWHWQFRLLKLRLVRFSPSNNLRYFFFTLGIESVFAQYFSAQFLSLKIRLFRYNFFPDYLSVQISLKFSFSKLFCSNFCSNLAIWIYFCLIIFTEINSAQIFFNLKSVISDLFFQISLLTIFLLEFGLCSLFFLNIYHCKKKKKKKKIAYFLLFEIRFSDLVVQISFAQILLLDPNTFAQIKSFETLYKFCHSKSICWGLDFRNYFCSSFIPEYSSAHI